MILSLHFTSDHYVGITLPIFPPLQAANIRNNIQKVTFIALNLHDLAACEKATS